MPEISIEDKVTESAFFLAPSLFQEVYHRGFLPLVVGKLGINNPNICHHSPDLLFFYSRRSRVCHLRHLCHLRQGCQPVCGIFAG
ncbi:hypothetical protein ACL1BT_14650, partial [Corynebacterium striatum]